MFSLSLSIDVTNLLSDTFTLTIILLFIAKANPAVDGWMPACPLPQCLPGGWRLSACVSCGEKLEGGPRPWECLAGTGKEPRISESIAEYCPELLWQNFKTVTEINRESAQYLPPSQVRTAGR
ncbi:hypothetical protein E2C01_077387 [Portunus trituberculatus]|uniref:Uncharacterized protein n=1 Tax=Portunus trituberculatus TaxID=210409 RepID=A0A5B7IM53_PORTR|nr:hypothetical protein [Portunus trituberculatus]